MAAPRERGVAARRHGVTCARPPPQRRSRLWLLPIRGVTVARPPPLCSARDVGASRGGGGRWRRSGASRLGPAGESPERVGGPVAALTAGSGPGWEPRSGREVGAGPKQKAGGRSGPAAALRPAAEEDRRVPPSGPGRGPRPAAPLFAAEGGGGRARSRRAAAWAWWRGGRAAGWLSAAVRPLSAPEPRSRRGSEECRRARQEAREELRAVPPGAFVSLWLTVRARGF